MTEYNRTSIEAAAKRVAQSWNVPPRRPGKRDPHASKFQVEVKRRRVVITAKDRFEHGR